MQSVQWATSSVNTPPCPAYAALAPRCLRSISQLPRHAQSNGEPGGNAGAPETPGFKIQPWSRQRKQSEIKTGTEVWRLKRMSGMKRFIFVMKSMEFRSSKFNISWQWTIKKEKEKRHKMWAKCLFCEHSDILLFTFAIISNKGCEEVTQDRCIQCGIINQNSFKGLLIIQFPL